MNAEAATSRQFPAFPGDAAFFRRGGAEHEALDLVVVGRSSRSLRRSLSAADTNAIQQAEILEVDVR